ncbi:Phospholipase D [Forsythia ovata]|uniref:Phospholipase D n=1 Tax=Forsythia ovata TaxID=205694 RepID=A0ABD1NYE7_9LAMI
MNYRPFGSGVILGGYDRDGPQLYMVEPSGVSYVLVLLPDSLKKADDQISELKEAFSLFDKDGDGSILEGVMGIGDEETKRFLKHSSVQVLRCPRSAGKGSWAKKKAFRDELHLLQKIRHPWCCNTK